MKRSQPRILISLAIFVGLPFLYNACGAVGQSATFGSPASNSFASSCAARTRQALPIDQRITDEPAWAPDSPELPGAFGTNKVQLDVPTAPGATIRGATARSAGTTRLAAGTELAVLVSGDCLRANASALGDQMISRAALASKTLVGDLDAQAFEWILPTAMTAAQITAQANAEACVRGVSLNQTYGMNAVSFNDPGRSYQTYLGPDLADQAYDVVFGATGIPTTGANVIVAVLDSGVDWNHPDLRGKMAPAIGRDVANNTDSPADVSSNGHGTHVAGMIAASANNGVGISGVMPYRAQILAVRIFASATSGTKSRDIYNGVAYAIEQGASVINLSVAQVIKGVANDALLQEAMVNAVNAGITVTTVVGNSDQASGIGYAVDGVTTSVIPGQFATIPGVIGVGSYDSASGALSSFSMYGATFAEIGAPGAQSTGAGQDLIGVYSTVPTTLGGLGGYGRLAGTSQAAPQVAAAAALVYAVIQSSYVSRPPPGVVEQLILDSADKSQVLAPYFRNGNRLNLLNLVNLIRTRYPRTASGATNGC